MEKISTLMKKMNVLELIEQIVELTHDQGITTEIKKGKVRLVSPAKPYIKELMTRLGIENEMEALFFASSYAFCGGQIENIARKQLIDNVLNENKALDITAIHEACKSESLSKHKTSRIGF